MAHLTKSRNSSSFSRAVSTSNGRTSWISSLWQFLPQVERMLPAPVATNHSLAPLAGGSQLMSTLWRSNMATFTVNVIDYPIQTGHFLLILMAELDEPRWSYSKCGFVRKLWGVLLYFFDQTQYWNHFDFFMPHPASKTPPPSGLLAFAPQIIQSLLDLALD